MALHQTKLKNPNTNCQILTAKNLFLTLLFLAAFLERVVFDLGPNIELVTMAMILASFYLGKKEAFWLTFAIIAFTDRLIGNGLIFLFTWSGFLIPAFFVNSVLKKLGTKGIKEYVFGTGAGLGSNLFFYFWTNFGVWLLDSWNMYPNTFQGLMLSYINALPFLKYQMTSTLIFVPLGFAATQMTIAIYKKLYPSPGLVSQRLV